MSWQIGEIRQHIFAKTLATALAKGNVGSDLSTSRRGLEELLTEGARRGEREQVFPGKFCFVKFFRIPC
jgi:hypothetical protein